MYFLTFQFANENRMTWIDRHGFKHSLTVIGSNNCDDRKPFLVTDTDEITDKEKLPILGITYGPLTHEAEKMTISIGPLICKPASANQENKMDQQFEALESLFLPSRSRTVFFSNIDSGSTTALFLTAGQ